MSALTTRSPRELLMTTTPSLHCARLSLLNMPLVSGVRGTCTVMKSDLRNRSESSGVNCTLLSIIQALRTERKGSYPMTSMPRRSASLATMAPIAPSPMTPSVLPATSCPTNLDLPFSTSLEMFSCPFRVCVQLAPSTIFLPPRNSSHRTSSLTALAFAPGVLKTTIPFSVHLSMGMLLTPAPARATASRFSPRG